MCERLWTGQAETKKTHDYCLRPKVGHLLHAAKGFQCCDTFGRQTARALDGYETLNAATNVLEQNAPVPLTRMAN